MYKHENIIKLERFFYKPEVFEDSELIIVTSKTEENLSTFIENTKGKHLKQEVNKKKFINKKTFKRKLLKL